MLIPKPALVLVVVILATYAVVLALLIRDAWNDYQDSFTTTFRNMTDEALCLDHCQPIGSVIDPHSTAHFEVDSSCFKQAQARIYTESGDLIYSRTADCGDWDNHSILINKRGNDYIAADDFDSSTYKP